MVSMPAFSNDPSSNPIFVKIVVEKDKNKQKRGWGLPIKNIFVIRDHRIRQMLAPLVSVPRASESVREIEREKNHEMC